MFSEKHIELAASFIKGNAELRTALGLDSSAALEARPLGSGEHNINFSLWEIGDSQEASHGREGSGSKPTFSRKTGSNREAESDRENGGDREVESARDLQRVLRINLGTLTGNDHQVTYEAAALGALESS